MTSEKLINTQIYSMKGVKDVKDTNETDQRI